MKLKIKLNNNKLCDGCPCLELLRGDNYHSRCRMGYDVIRIGLDRMQKSEKYKTELIGNPYLIDYFETIRSKQCIKDND